MLQKSPQFLVPDGSIDGVNTTFQTPTPYIEGTLAVFLNGQLKRQDFEDGWQETNPGIGIFDLNIAPIDGDVVQTFYLTMVDVGFRAEVVQLAASLREVKQLYGDVLAFQHINGTIEESEEEGAYE
jgi:hypothetical protein